MTWKEDEGRRGLCSLLINRRKIKENEKNQDLNAMNEKLFLAGRPKHGRSKNLFELFFAFIIELRYSERS
jgi:hypothetical protein